MPSLDTVQILATALITLLGSPSYRQREAATRALQSALPAAVPYLEAADGHRDQEIARRVQRLLARHRREQAEQLASALVPKGWKQHPWITFQRSDGTCPEDDRCLRDWCLRTAMGRSPCSPPAWQAYREATRLYLLHLLLERQVTPAEARLLLEDMAEQERQWVREHGRPYNLAVPP
jgi:hypothetical protein